MSCQKCKQFIKKVKSALLQPMFSYFHAATILFSHGHSLCTWCIFLRVTSKVSLFIYLYHLDFSFSFYLLKRQDKTKKFIWTVPSGGTRFFFWGGGTSRGKNAILRGQKSQNLPKMADFGHFVLLTGGASGGRASDWGGDKMPTCPPWCRHWQYRTLSWHLVQYISCLLTQCAVII